MSIPYQTYRYKLPLREVADVKCRGRRKLKSGNIIIRHSYDTHSTMLCFFVKKMDAKMWSRSNLLVKTAHTNTQTPWLSQCHKRPELKARELLHRCCCCSVFRSCANVVGTPRKCGLISSCPCAACNYYLHRVFVPISYDRPIGNMAQARTNTHTRKHRPWP